MSENNKELTPANFVHISPKEMLRTAAVLSGCVNKCIAKWPYFWKEKFGEQLVRSLLSAGSNYAEGLNRTPNQKCAFFGIAQGSAQEALHQLETAMYSGLIKSEFIKTHRPKLITMICHISTCRWELEDITFAEYKSTLEQYGKAQKENEDDS